jgi:hypothetical protein
MKGFLKMLFCAIMILTAGIAYAGGSGIITQQDKSRLECDQGVPCSFQIAVQTPVIEIVQFYCLAGMNIRDVANVRASLYLISAKNSNALLTQYSLHIDPGNQSVLNSVHKTTDTRCKLLHIDPGNC